MVQITQASMYQYMILQCDMFAFYFSLLHFTYLLQIRFSCCEHPVVPPSYVCSVYVGGAVHLVAEVS